MTVERITNLFLIAASAVAMAYAGSGLYRNLTRKKLPDYYSQGERIRDNGNLRFGQARRTVLLVTSSSCRFCEASLGFYADLARVAREKGVRIVSVPVDDKSTNRDYLPSHGVAVDAIVPAPQAGIRLRATPDLTLVDQRGVVIGTWHGLLSKEREQDVFAALD